MEKPYHNIFLFILSAASKVYSSLSQHVVVKHLYALQVTCNEYLLFMVKYCGLMNFNYAISQHGVIGDKLSSAYVFIKKLIKLEAKESEQVLIYNEKNPVLQR